MATFEEQLNSLLERAKSIVPPNKLKTAAEKQPADKWMNDVQIFYDTYLKNHALGQRMHTLLFDAFNWCIRGIGFLLGKHSWR